MSQETNEISLYLIERQVQKIDTDPIEGHSVLYIKGTMPNFRHQEYIDVMIKPMPWIQAVEESWEYNERAPHVTGVERAMNQNNLPDKGDFNLTFYSIEKDKFDPSIFRKGLLIPIHKLTEDPTPLTPRRYITSDSFKQQYAQTQRIMGSQLRTLADKIIHSYFSRN